MTSSNSLFDSVAASLTSASAGNPSAGTVTVLCWILTALIVITLISFLIHVILHLGEKCIASKKIIIQILGAAIDYKGKWFFFLFISLLTVAGMSYIISPQESMSYLWICLLTFSAWLIIKTSYSLTDVFSLRKEEERITWCQIFALLAIGFWIIGFLIIYDPKEKPQITAALGVIGGLLSLIFQDKVKGVMAFFHLRLHHMLKIGDWIKVPKYNIDGYVQRISLTTVTIYNIDTTTSTIPINALHSDHFINLQNMAEGKTYGRRMVLTFKFDTEWIKPISSTEENELKSHEAISRHLPADDIKAGTLNAHLFRLYLYHWLMVHPHISQKPHLIVKWLEQNENGLSLQISAFVTDSSLEPFVWQQSLIIEHIIESSQWFHMVMFQNPSDYDFIQQSN